jgi:putative ABC transport system permease protein
LISFLEIFGLSVGMTIGLYLIIIVKSQLSYDTFHPNPEKTFRVVTDVRFTEGTRKYATTPFTIRNDLSSYSFIDEVVTLYPLRSAAVKIGNETFYTKTAFTGNNFFSVFGFRLKDGHTSSPLENPFSAVLSKAAAKRFFGKTSAVGQILYVEKIGLFTVTGVIDDTNYKSHIDYELLLSISTPPTPGAENISAALDKWGSFDNSYNYVLLNYEGSESKLESALSQLSANANNAIAGKDKIKLLFRAQYINDVYPSSLAMEIGPGISGQFLWILAGVAFVVMLMSLINYFNLSVAKSFSRLKEIGIRKVTGAQRFELFTQLLIESVVRSLCALLIAIFICLGLPLEHTPVTYSFAEVFHPYLILPFVAYSLVVGIAAGFIPSLVLSRIRPTDSLNKLANNTLLRQTAFGKPLIGLQFVISLTFLIVLSVMYRQSEYMKNSDYGFNKTNIYAIPLRGTQSKALSDIVSGHSNVSHVFQSSDLMAIGRTGNVCKMKPNDGVEPIAVDYIAADKELIPSLELKLLAGTNFSSSQQRTETSIIINEVAVKSLGFNTPAECIGRPITVDDSLQLEIIGVIKNFNYQSFKFPIRSFALRQRPDEFRYLNLKVSSMDQLFETFLEKAWNRTGSTLEFSLIDYENVFLERQAYKKDLSLIGTFSILAMVISVLGLFGVILFNLQKRVKEIGIRKVYGGSVYQILLMLIKQFLILISVSTATGCITGFFISKQLLEEFTYRTPITIGLFVYCISFIVGLSLLMIGFQCFKAANSNPIKTLRME